MLFRSVSQSRYQGPDDRVCLFAQSLHIATDWQAEIVVTMDATIQYREWDNQIVERMFIPDIVTGEELAVGATDAFTSSDAAPVPDTSTEDAQITRNYYTAIKAAEYLYRKATKNVDSFSSGGTSVNYANRASRLLDLIAQLRTKLLSINNISTVVYASRPSYYSEV